MAKFTPGTDLSFSAAANRGGGFSRGRLSLIIFSWIVAGFLMAYMVHISEAGWDAKVYWKAAKCLHRGGDPYAEGIAVQRAFRDRTLPIREEHPPFTYVYSPLTLPLLRMLAAIPGRALAALYGAALLAGFLLQYWAGWQMADAEERPTLAVIMPFVPLFPGFLLHDVVLSANLAYILYGLILVAAVLGWKRERWSWYYLAVLIASVFKAPLLTLIAFPVLVSRLRQWLPAAITGAAGLALFGAPALIWPQLFKEYLRAVFLQFEWNHDFGFSPSGILSEILFSMKKNAGRAPTILYLVFAAVLVAILLYVAHRVRQGYLSRELWIPVALLGTVLANPRIKEYDVAAITIPMLLLSRRALRFIMNHFSDGAAKSVNGLPAQGHSDEAVFLAGAGWFLVFNFLGIQDWKFMELGILILLFGLGIWSLYQLRVEAAPLEASDKPGGEYAESLEQLQRVAQ